MPTFDTPEPVTVTIRLALGDVRITATPRRDTVVTVRPSRDGRDLDVDAAEQTRVEHADGRVVVETPKTRGLARYFSSRYGSVNVALEVPEGSSLQVEAASASVDGHGRLGDVRIHNALGDVRLHEAGDLHVETHGSVTVDRASGHAEVTGAGEVRLGAVDGRASVKNVNGDTWVGEVEGALAVRAANGDIAVDGAHAEVRAKTANGTIRVGEVVRGAIALETAYGEIEIGVREGTAAWLDVNSRSGHVRNALKAADGPQPAMERAEIRARTAYGDIVIRRA